MKVKHKKFGEGKLLKTTGIKPEEVLHIEFDSGIKQILKKFADIEYLSSDSEKKSVGKKNI